MLDAFATALAFGRWAVLITDHSSSVHGCRLVKCFVVRHETVVRILWRGPDEGLYTLGLHMHNSLTEFCVAESRAVNPAFLSLRFGVAVLHWVSGASVVAFCFHTKRSKETGHG